MLFFRVGSGSIIIISFRLIPFLPKNISFPLERKRNFLPNRPLRIYEETIINLFLTILLHPVDIL